MKRKLFLTLITSAALTGAHAQAGGAQSDMPRQDTDEQQQQQEQHVIASPNPTVDDSKTSSVEPGKVTATRAQPATTATAAPMKKAARPKRKRTKPRTD